MKQTLAPPPVDEAGSQKSATNGSGSRAEPLALTPPRMVRSRIPQALLAALLIVGGGLGGLMLFSRYNQRAPAVVVTEPVSHGRALTREDLAITEVALDGNVATIASISDAVGRFAAHDLEPGELVTSGDLADEDQLVTADESVIGLLLEPGQYPTKRMVAGDRVDVFAPGASIGGAGARGSESGAVESPDPAFGNPAGPLATDLVVFDVVESSSDGRNLLVSIVVTAPEAATIFNAADSTGVRLSLRGEG